MILLAALCLLLPVRSGAGPGGGDLRHFLETEAGFSDAEFLRLRNGEVVTKHLEAQVRQELAVVGVVQVNVPEAVFTRNYGRGGLDLETAAAETKGAFGASPHLEDVRGFCLPPDEIRELAAARPKDCKVKASAELIRRFKAFDRDAPDLEAAGNRVIRQTLVDYVREYVRRGDASLIVYDDKDRPIRMADEFEALLEGSHYLQAHLPELHAYLRGFPKVENPRIENVICWMKEDYGGRKTRPVLSVNHMALYKRPEADPELAVATKQLYATHYFEAALGLTLTLDDPDKGGPGFYLVHIHRSRIDLLRTIPPLLAKGLFREVEDLLREKMSRLKQSAESAYQAGGPSQPLPDAAGPGKIRTAGVRMRQAVSGN